MDKARAINLLEDIQQGVGTVFEVTQELAEAAELAITELWAGCYFDDLYKLCNRVYTEKPEVENFNEYVKSLILKDLEQN